jgi:predicted CoA-binding protein
MDKTTLVLGASPNPERFSNKAVKNLQRRNIPFIAIGKREDNTGNIHIIKGMPSEIGPVHTVTLYLSAHNQKEYYDYILSIKPKRIIFNPGTLNPEFAEVAKKSGIETVNDCMLVMLNTGKF